MTKLIAISCCIAVFVVDVAATPVESDTISGRSLSEVVVTGSNVAVGRDLMPYTVSVIGRRELDMAGSSNVLTAISGEVPSLFVTQRGILGFGGSSNGGAGHIKMRGVGGDRASGVLMMVDGQPQFAGIYSHHVGDFYGKEQVERVEVLRGPGSVLYGSNAMAGVINVITRKPTRDGVHASVSSQYGSYNTWQTAFTGTARYGRFSSLLSLSYDRTDGNVENFDFKQAGGYGKISYDFSGRWKMSADYTLMNFVGDDPLFPKLSDSESTDVYHQNVTRGEASLTLSNRYDTTGGDVRVYYSYGNHYIDDPRHFHSLDDRFGVLAYQNLTPWRDAAMTLGFDFNTYTGEIPVSGGNSHKPGSMSTISRKSVTEYSPYITVSQGFVGHKIIINGGLRVANSDKFDTQLVPQAGIVVNPVERLTLKASLAKGYRNPSFREMYLYRMANSGLEPERMMNYEVSVGFSLSRYLGVDVTGYYSKGDNMIQVLDNKNVNTGRFINKGIEVTVRSHLRDNLMLRVTYSYLDTSLRNLTGAPCNQYFLGVDWQALKRLNVSADLKGIGGLYVSDDLHRQNYAVLNMRVGYDVCRYLSLFTRLENITDARYTINRGYPMPGFTAMGGFKLNI